MASSITGHTLKEELISKLKNSEINEKIAKNNPLILKEKAEYMQFLKILLKIKFQKLHNSHMGQQIPAKPVYLEAKRMNITIDNWPDFIFAEIKQPHKYIQFIRADRLKNKKKFSYNANIDTHNTSSPEMGGKSPELFTIDEESNMTQL